MSDLASPLLVVMNNEALAYICFCALMKRLRRNFQLNGRMMTRKFKDLCELLEHYDPGFYEYLREAHADDLLFCYRWLLLELKREFTFDDALMLMEVNWASLPADPPEKELDLCCGASVKSCQLLCSSCVNMTCSCAALRQYNREIDQSISNDEPVYRNSFSESNRMFSFGQDDSLDSGRPIYFQSRHRFDSLSSCQSCPACLADPSGRTVTITASVTPTQNITWMHEEICAIPLSTHNSCTLSSRSEQPSQQKCGRLNDSQNGCALEDTKVKSRRTSTTTNCSATAAANVIDSGFCESQAFNTMTDLTSKASVADVAGINRLDKEDVAPEGGRQELMVDQLGGGNPFLMFVCVALFLEHRDLIMERKMDFNDIAMYFDSLMKRHNVRKVLQQARIFYSEYRSNGGAQRTTDVVHLSEQRRAN
ncbi:hypothetical protein M514_06514 [Trichuris suis]|uniref:Rab-GAP TBC domain-containing protein n=1 Tax=Trichuris suis TaxID=68888 RepID=A0A085M621_9BILA|nr:hypothetical protein M513_06514 [Trichuris suis]KFD63828.1 hypothetical protein M514_06514 [Trichuris suis]